MRDIAVICIWYNPTEDLIKRWTSMDIDACRLIVVDNTPKDKINSGFNLRESEKFFYLPLYENMGIAAAQNMGIAKAKELGYKYVVFFDQDSEVDSELIENLRRDFDKIKSSGVKVGAVGPTVVEISSGKSYIPDSKKSDNANEVISMISSGTFTEISVLEDVGGMEESLFIDMVDYEWCWRAVSKGYRLFISPNAILKHQVGMNFFTLAGMHIVVSSPLRYFYRIRNSRRMLLRGYVPFKWKVKSVIKNGVTIFAIPFVSNFKGHRLETLKYSLKGLISK